MTEVIVTGVVFSLSAEELEALRFARYRLVKYAPVSGSNVVLEKAALAVLDRLLADGVIK